ncbi:MAG: PocR ligand-binding domain-containing protein [Pseudomonadota bacterium]
MLLTDIYPLENWIELEKKIVDQSGLDSNVFDINGIRISDYKHWANNLCPAIKATDKGQSFICAVAHMNISILTRRSRQAVIGECDAGLLKLVVPIFVKGEFLGSIGACGMLVDDGELDPFLIHKTTDIDEKKIEYLALSVNKITSDNVNSITQFIQQKINEIIKGQLG